jgi:D-beta-D-heptose 7-phosphate kinase / D-beta-D-heptose 1-phosphate adenosyltransferase
VTGFDTVTPELPRVLQQAAPRVAVVGDLMLDGWWVGRSERMSREAPAPVVEIGERYFAPGGAANTAMNLAALGAKVLLVGVVGIDEAGNRLLRLLAEAGVGVDGVHRDAATTTVTKNRIVSSDQILLRIDEVRHNPPALAAQDRVAAALAVALPAVDAVVICDYDSGLLFEPVRRAFGLGDRPPLVVVDAHDPAPWSVLQPDLVTPNAAEAARVLGITLPEGARPGVLDRAASELHDRTGAAAVLVTLDRDGTVLLDRTGILHRTWAAKPGTEKQAAGAGDTFVATLTMARAAGVPLPVAADLAQAAADVVVQRFGTSVCSAAELTQHLEQLGAAVLDEEALIRRVTADRAAGRRIVLTNGCFDVLHRGHTTYLAQAAQLGDVLVVAVNSDNSVRRLKGPQRPINSAADRAGVIAALSCVTYVTVFETDTPIPLIERLRPDVYTKGGDYSPEMLAEAEVVRRYGGEVRMLDYVADHSTTSVLTRIRSQTASR